MKQNHCILALIYFEFECQRILYKIVPEHSPARSGLAPVDESEQRGILLHFACQNTSITSLLTASRRENIQGQKRVAVDFHQFFTAISVIIDVILYQDS